MFHRERKEKGVIMTFLKEFEIWARAGRVSEFPRAVGFERVEVKDEVELYEYVQKCGWLDCYSALFARGEKFDTVLMDVDGHDSQWNADVKVSKLLRVLKDRGLKHRVYWTGRGYHVFVDFEPVKLNDYRAVMLKWFEVLGVKELIDLNASGSENRIARLPKTVNAKAGKMMERISDADGFNEGLADELISYDVEKVEVKEVERICLNLNEEELPICVKEGIERLRRTGELSHQWRFHIATFLLKVWDYDRVKNVFRVANDFNERVTDYQLQQILKRGYKCYGCKKLKVLGMCSFDDLSECAFYDLTGGWLEVIGGAPEK